MPARKRKSPPAASRKKRVMHAFYLAQPFLQFAALMAVLFVLGRCSPLSPSQDKSLNKISSDGVKSRISENSLKNAEEDDIKRELKEISSLDELQVISQSDFNKLSAAALDADKPADLSRVKSVFAQRLRARGSVRLLSLNLTADQRLEITTGSGLKKPIDLADRLGQTALTGAELRRSYFGELHKTSHLDARAVLVLPDDAMRSPDAVKVLPIATKISLAIFPNDEKAYLQVVRIEQRLDDQQQELIKSNLEKSLFLALLLE